MKIILDLFPILLFFAAYKYASIYEATAVLMGATVVQSLLMYKMDGKLSTMQKASLGLILVFGSLTLFFHDDRFIKYKPTLLYGCLALALLGSQFVFKRNLLHSMLGSQVNLPPANWHALEHRLDCLLRFHGGHQCLCCELTTPQSNGSILKFGAIFFL
jgi:intracellular septation protein